jgi:hypothetical protein
VFVEEILTATDYYRVLNVTKKATPEHIRRAYIKVRANGETRWGRASNSYMKQTFIA